MLSLVDLHKTHTLNISALKWALEELGSKLAIASYLQMKECYQSSPLVLVKKNNKR